MSTHLKPTFTACDVAENLAAFMNDREIYNANDEECTLETSDTYPMSGETQFTARVWLTDSEFREFIVTVGLLGSGKDNS